MLKSTKGMEKRNVTRETKLERSLPASPMPTIIASSRFRKMLSL
jgi:hypothetical protein